MNEAKVAEAVKLTEQTLLPEVEMISADPRHPVEVPYIPSGWKLLGAGNYAAVFEHPEAEGIAVKVYAPGRPGWERECEVYGKLGNHPAYAVCYHAGFAAEKHYLLLKKLSGKTLYNCLLEGTPIPEQVIADIDEALEYARLRGLNPRDVHGKNVMLSKGRGLVVDVSDFLEEGPCTMWDDLKAAYERIYTPFLSKRPFPIPVWVMEGVRSGYRWIRKTSELSGKEDEPADRTGNSGHEH
ncbi:serine/threonine protein kinase [Paenibacillus beijingensis]|uniref:Serine/threonine protein kinase n=1 Tax=Paenibacillus beijingensis TaxID=1126833 RepID=A0A0D5NH32_9BACL|nr:serine/threonine protein kinase [Paenibacillus beijingensis]AJY74591.1 serine/threonine protein kinase [Paenibacillus beijingensis]